MQAAKLLLLTQTEHTNKQQAHDKSKTPEVLSQTILSNSKAFAINQKANFPSKHRLVITYTTAEIYQNTSELAFCRKRGAWSC